MRGAPGDVVDAVRRGRLARPTAGVLPVHGETSEAPCEFEPSQEFEDATVELMDIDGDGWRDVVEIGNGELRYWPKFLEARTGFHDLNGDGSVDFVDARDHADTSS
jgi:hypothetical protein